jgi:hypothetical protein
MPDSNCNKIATINKNEKPGNPTLKKEREQDHNVKIE